MTSPSATRTHDRAMIAIARALLPRLMLALIAAGLLIGPVTAGPSAEAPRARPLIILPTTFDDFGDAQGPLSTAGTTSSSQAQAAGTIEGSERDMEVSLSSGAGPVTAQVASSAMTFSSPAGTSGMLNVQWDGTDGSAALDATGLAGVDITHAGTDDALQVIVNSATSGTVLKIEVFTDADTVSVFRRVLPAITAATTLNIAFTEFFGNADFTDVGAVQLMLEGDGVAAALGQPILSVSGASAIEATKVDSLPVAGDFDADGVADPGENVAYTVDVLSSGTTASGTAFNDTVDSNSTLVGGSVETTPLALDDGYDSLGNVGISVSAAFGVLLNDSDPDGSGLATPPISASDATSNAGGTVSVTAADGAFTYTPPAGFEGVDFFSYTIDDDEGNSDTATVFITVSDVIWFVDNSLGAVGDGTLAAPFNCLFDSPGTNCYDDAADDPGDVIFVYTGGFTYPDGTMTLKNNQILIGQGASSSIQVITGITPPAHSNALPATGGTRPVLTNSSGAAITLASNNEIHGLNVGNTGGAGIFGNFGSLKVRDMSITGTGQALDLTNGTLDAQFDNLASINSAAQGIKLATITGGSLTVSALTQINNATSEGIRISMSAATFTFDDVDVLNRNTTGILITGNTGGSVTFADVDIPNPATGYGVRVDTSASPITFASLDITGATVGTAEVDANADFIPENEGDGDGVFLMTNTAAFDLNGGTIQNTGGDGIDARDQQNITLSGVTVQNPSGHGFRGIDLKGTGHRIDTSSAFTQINGTSRDAVRLINTVSDAMAIVVDDSDFSSSGAGGNAIFVSARNSADMDVTVQNTCTFQDFGSAAVVVNAGDTVGSTARVDLIVDNCTFTGTTANVLTTVSGQGLESGTLTARIEDNTFTDVAQVLGSNTGVITLNGNDSSSNEVTIQRNRIESSSLLTGYRGIQVFADDNSTYTGNIVIEDNDVFDVDREGLVLDIATNGGSAINAKIEGNDFGSAIDPVGTDGNRRGVTIFTRRANPNAPVANVLFDDNRVFISSTSSTRQPLEITAEDDAKLDLTLTSNTAENLGTSDDGRFSAYDNGIMCTDISGNAFGTGGPGAINLREIDVTATFNVEQASSAAVTTANNSVVVNTSGTISFNVACAAPPTFFLSDEPVDDGAEPEADDAEAEAAAPAISAARAVALARSAVDGAVALLEPASVAYAEPAITTQARAVDADVPGDEPAAPASGETVSLTLGNMPPGKSVTIEFDVTVDSPFPLGTTQISNQGTVTANAGGLSELTDDPDVGGAIDPTVTTIDMLSLGDQVWQDDNSNNVFDGTPTDTVINSVTVNLYVDDGTTAGSFDAGDTFHATTTTAGGGIYGFGDLVPGEYIVELEASNFAAAAPLDGLFTLAGAPDPDNNVNNDDNGEQVGGSVASKAVTLAYNTEPNTDGDADTDTNLSVDFGFVASQADVSVTKDDGVTSAVPGQDTVVYTIVVGNAGPDADPSVSVADTFPAALTCTYTSVAAGGATGNTAAGAGDLAETLSMPVSSSVTYTVSCSIDPGATGTLSNTATVTPSSGDPDSSNNSATDSDTVLTPQADLSISKSDSPDPVVAGNNLVYTVRVDNNGPSDAQNVVVADTLPAGVSSASTSGCLEDPAGVPTCTLGTIAASGFKQYTITVTVDADVADGTTLTNNASVSSSTTLTDTGDDSTSEDTLVNAEADLTVSKSDSPDPVVAGNNLVYTVRVDNNGPSDAQNVVVVDTLPAGVTFVSTSGCAEDPNGVPTCTLGTIAASGFKQYTITVTVDADVADGTTLTNQASVSSSTTLTDTGDDSTSEDTLVNAEADLTISKSDSPDPVVAGNNLVYTVRVDNAGPSDAQNVVVVDTLPAGVTLVSTSGCAEDPNGVPTCTLGTIAAGGFKQYTITVTVDAPVSAGVVSVTNQASVSSSTTLTDTGDDSTTESTAIDAEPDLTLAKDDGGITAPPGTVIVYTLTYDNVGNQDATGVKITDVVPANTTFNQAASGGAGVWSCADGSPAGTSCEHTIGNVPVASPAATVDFAVTVDAVLPPGVTQVENTAVIADDAANGADPNPGDNTATDTTPVLSADISVTKTDSPDPVRAGNKLTYTIDVTNDGPSPANVIMTDTLPVQVTYESMTPPAGWACTTPPVGSTGTIVCGPTNMGNGAMVSFEVVVRVPPGTPANEVLVNTVTVTGDEFDPDTTNNQEIEESTVYRTRRSRPGDCNIDGKVDAGDLNALTLTIFNVQVSDAAGCDANNDLLINAGDLSCTVLLIFNGPGSCGLPTNSSDAGAGPIDFTPIVPAEGATIEPAGPIEPSVSAEPVQVRPLDLSGELTLPVQPVVPSMP